MLLDTPGGCMLEPPDPEPPGPPEPPMEDPPGPEEPEPDDCKNRASDTVESTKRARSAKPNE